jgi:hypothetical protein
MSNQVNGNAIRKVFVLEPTKHDLTDASRFGDIIYLYHPEERRPPMWTHAFIQDCLARLEKNDYDPEVDYFLIGGPHTPVTLLAAHMIREFPAANLLLFDSTQSEYIPKLI